MNNKEIMEARRKRRKKPKKPYSSMTITTGDIGYNIDRFNQAMDTDFSPEAADSGIGVGAGESGAIGENFKLKESWEEFDFEDYNSDDTITVVITDKRFDPLFKKDHRETVQRNSVKVEGQYFNGVVITGKVRDIIQVCGECHVMNPNKIFREALSLVEAKRYVRRYYIRPQNIFCSNKAEIIKALIDIGNENCSVYTLNNLGDEKDVTKLMNKDIIYYYDDGILYDKNKVKVMDYDLSIKKEENRKKFSGNANSVSDATFKDTYEDRMTDMTELEEDVFFDKSSAEVYTSIDDNTIYVGTDDSHKDVGIVYDGNSSSPYSHTDWIVSEDENGIFTLTGWLMGHDGEVREGPSQTYYSIEELEAALVTKGLKSLEQSSQLEEAFNQDFEPVDVWGYSLRESVITCCICGEEVDGYGNNPEPYRQKGKCCDACNIKFVIPARLEAMRAGEDSDAD